MTLPSNTVAIARLILVVSATIGNHIACTSPQPPPSTSEMKGYKSTSPLNFILSSKWTPTIAKLVVWFIAIREVLLVAPLLFPLEHDTSIATGPADLSTSFVLGTLFAFSGGILRWLCYRTLGRHFTFQLSIKKDHALVKEGPYSFVRHPGYTAFLFTFFGTMTWYLSEFDSSLLGLLFFAAYTITVGSVVVGMITRLPVEDSTLRSHFGKEWEEWAAVARWQLFPGVY